MEAYNVNEIDQITQDFEFDEFDIDDKTLSQEEVGLFKLSKGHKRVLVVDDDITQLNFLEDLIAEINPDVEVDWESDAHRAINLIASSSNQTDRRDYDLIISDIVLEGEASGMTLFEYCTSYQPNTDFLLISAHSREKLRNSYFKNYEPLEFMKKPLNFTAFYKRVMPKLVVTV